MSATKSWSDERKDDDVWCLINNEEDEGDGYNEADRGTHELTKNVNNIRDVRMCDT
jgi:hypothetical protein